MQWTNELFGKVLWPDNMHAIHTVERAPWQMLRSGPPHAAWQVRRRMFPAHAAVAHSHNLTHAVRSGRSTSTETGSST